MVIFQYLRLKYEESPDVVDNVIHLLKEHWKIMEPRTPSLIISVVGGAKNFKLSGKMRETFQSGLIKVFILHLILNEICSRLAKSETCSYR